MRLLFVNYEFPPVGGGAAHASFATAREMVQLGHDVDFLTTASGGRAGEEILDGIRVLRTPSIRRGVHEAGMLGAMSFVARAATRIGALASARRYDLCHYYFGVPTGVLSLLPGAHRALPYIVSLRGSDVPGYEPALDVAHRLLQPLTHRIWGGAWRVVANSEDLRRMAQRSAPGLEIDVILNGATAVPLLPARSEARTGLRVLTVSRLIARKGLATMIRSLRTPGCDTLILEIAGDGPDERELQQLARECGVADRVKFHGFVGRDALTVLRAECDVFLLASRSESCSVALLEAFAAGLPVVATAVGGNVELVHKGLNGLLFDVDNVEQLGVALSTLAENPALRLRMSAANRAFIRERCSWRVTAERYERLFKAAIGMHEGLAADPVPMSLPAAVDGSAQ